MESSVLSTHPYTRHQYRVITLKDLSDEVKCIGAGAYGRVGVRYDQDKPVAVKTPTDGSAYLSFRNELLKSSYISSTQRFEEEGIDFDPRKHVVRTIGGCSTQEPSLVRANPDPCIVTELQVCSLAEYLHVGKQLTQGEMLWLFFEACKGVRILHRHQIYHRDVHQGNLLFGPDGQLRIADMGISRALSSSCRLIEGYYRAPETMLRRPEQAALEEPRLSALARVDLCDPHKAGLHSDIWSLAMVIISMGCPDVLFEIHSPSSLYDKHDESIKLWGPAAVCFQSEATIANSLYDGAINQEEIFSAFVKRLKYLRAMQREAIFQPISHLLLRMLDLRPHFRPTIMDVIRAVGKVLPKPLPDFEHHCNRLRCAARLNSSLFPDLFPVSQMGSTAIMLTSFEADEALPSSIVTRSTSYLPFAPSQPLSSDFAPVPDGDDDEATSLPFAAQGEPTPDKTTTTVTTTTTTTLAIEGSHPDPPRCAPPETSDETSEDDSDVDGLVAQVQGLSPDQVRKLIKKLKKTGLKLEQ
eukprot:gnl/Trimastix_PCT/1973.p1 GENE.gnl/Trimastix_PCT/1973~~gnl/Trimastix_PCT/1973.p1  ORF type:complete len:526 (-),score=10.98 gnl/Trimastix_PCT/1973:21-1598(-)